MAIFVNAAGTSLIQGFTQDKNLLHAALLRTGPGPHVPNLFIYGANYGQANEAATMSLFTQLSRYLQDVRGRKNVIWLADNFPLNLFPDPRSHIPEEEVKQTIAVLTRSQVALYPIDVRGVTGGDLGSYVQEDTLANSTGGKAEYSDNDIADLLDRATSVGSSFYTLGYAPSNQNQNGEERRIEAKVRGGGYHLAYRQFYDAPATEPKASPKPGSVVAYQAASTSNDTLTASIEHGMPMLHDLIFSMHVRTEGKPKLATPQQMAQLITAPAYFRTRRKNRPLHLPPAMELQEYWIDYSVIDAQLRSAAMQVGKRPSLEFAVAGYDAQGRMVTASLNAANAGAPKAGEEPQAIFRLGQPVELPLETAWLRVAVRDPLTNCTGTIEIALPLKPEPSSQAVPNGSLH